MDRNKKLISIFEIGAMACLFILLAIQNTYPIIGIIFFCLIFIFLGGAVYFWQKEEKEVGKIEYYLAISMIIFMILFTSFILFQQLTSKMEFTFFEWPIIFSIWFFVIMWNIPVHQNYKNN